MGGGGGSSYNRNPGTGASGGSGGGGSYISITPSSGGSASQSNSGISGATGYGCTGGVSATGSQFGGGGGGGAGGAGSNATTTVAGKGGPGIQFSQFAGLVPGSPAGYFAGGGGGGAAGSTSGSGGLGGGGNGKAGLNLTGITGDNGTNNTGGGGGGSWDDSAIKTNAGGTGGSGIVIVRYLSSTDLAIISQSPTLLGPGNATVNGLLTGDGGGTNTAVAFCCGYSDAGTNSGTSAWTTVVAVGTNCSKGQNLSATLAGLLSGSSYVYRCYASNTTGSAWSDTQRFTTIYLPAVRNLGPVNSTSGSTFQSQVTDTGGEAPYCWFLYWLASGGPTTTVAVGQQSGVFTNFAGDLALQQVYQYEVMASNSAGIAWSTISNAMNTANIWYVKTNGNDGAAGTNWTLAFKTISNVAARATAGDLILVTNGVYAVSNVVISSTTTPITMRSVDANPENTVLAGPGAAAGNIMRVLVLTNVNVSGFTIFKGEARVDGSEGGGVYMVNSVLSNCMVKSCCGSRSSSVYASSGLVTRCTFTNNYDQSNQSGVGALKLTSGAIVEYCTFIGNKPGSSTSPSSALWMLGNCTARYCIFTNNLQNSAITAGITVTITAGDLLQNCLIANNQGRGISMSGGTVQNCTVSGNAIYGNTGNGISMSGGAVVNSIVYFNDSDFYTTIASDISMTGGAISNSCMGPGTFVSGNGNISAEPRFTNPAARDYTLMPGSPCIDTGSNILSMATDLAGNLRRIDGNGDGLAIQDMGCYEAPTVNSGSLRCGVVASAHEGIDALGVTFTPYAEGADTNINFAGWIFGDGTTSNRADLSAVGHTYSAPGSYTVSLLISNVSLQSATAVITNDVRVSPLATFVSTNGSVTWPYDTWAKAAAGIPGAMSALMATGSVPLTITISNGTYTLGAQLVITKPIMIQSWNNNPANVLVSGGGAVSIFNAVNPL
ncbi:MAG: glycine-rich domain-containing protein, partial [bacterium]